MDKRKNTLSALKICRFCLTQDVPMASLYDKKRKHKNAVNLPLKILSCVSVEVFPSDKMPSYICKRCKYFMNICYDFKQICRKADETILHYIQDNSALKPVPWPATLNDVYRDSDDIGVMKTVVEDGTTVQVTHDMSDSDEEEEEKLYNVKINDGSDDVSKTCVKVVASKQEDKNKKQKGGDAGDAGAAEERCWACARCERTFPLRQMLRLHTLRKHRQRTVTCDQCDHKFFSKYDLAIHQLRHSEDVPFQCVACGKKFKRLVLLKGHEKLMHADLAKHACQECPATFLSQEDLDEHIRKHEQYSARSHTCTVCNKKFQHKTSLQNHIYTVHERVPQYACDYCPQRYTSVNKLTSHIRSHAGDRPYPCKYCDKSFVKSHHYTRHIRVKHRDEERLESTQLEQYRCEQCDDAFANQDDLIYHSAIHATQNLTCPLCQEKFPDVDAVTTHIKSHVSGVEFMCDYCELVFTSKEKLDSHMLRAHEDELQQEMSQDTQDESSNQTMEGEIDADNEAEDDDCINVKEEGDHMVVEIKKASEFMLKKPQPELEKGQENSTEESNSESEYIEPASIESATLKKITQVKPAPIEASVKQPSSVAPKPVVLAKSVLNEQAVLQKSEEIKRRAAQLAPGSPAEKKEKTVQVTKTENANEKSLRLLEKELQDLKRTNSRSEAVKTPVKALEIPKPRGRPPLHSSTPKIKPAEEKRILNRTLVVEKKQPDKKIVTKENKEPKEAKEPKLLNKEDKDKSIVKNGTGDKSGVEDGIRRSTRPSKIKDYAKMIRVNTQEDSDSDELGDDDDDYKESDKSTEGRVKGRRNSVRPSKGSPAPAATTTAAAASPAAVAAPPRKRGRPRKETTPQELPAKVKRMEPEQEEELPAKSDEKPTKSEEKPSKSENTTAKAKANSAELKEKTVNANQETEENAGEGVSQPSQESKVDEMEINESQDNNVAEPKKDDSEGKEDDIDKNKELSKSPQDQSNSTSESKIVSPSGQALKKVPIRSLPPGVKPLPLNLGRSLPSGQLCEMQIGKKVVKVQKIVMTKAEVEAMAKQGLVEMKGGTMVLKHGIKLPTVDTVKAMSEDGDKENPNKAINKPVPTRCDIDNE